MCFKLVWRRDFRHHWTYRLGGVHIVRLWYIAAKYHTLDLICLGGLVLGRILLWRLSGWSIRMSERCVLVSTFYNIMNNIEWVPLAAYSRANRVYKQIRFTKFRFTNLVYKSGIQIRVTNQFYKIRFTNLVYKSGLQIVSKLQSSPRRMFCIYKGTMHINDWKLLYICPVLQILQDRNYNARRWSQNINLTQLFTTQHAGGTSRVLRNHSGSRKISSVRIINIFDTSEVFVTMTRNHEIWDFDSTIIKMANSLHLVSLSMRLICIAESGLVADKLYRPVVWPIGQSSDQRRTSTLRFYLESAIPPTRSIFVWNVKSAIHARPGPAPTTSNGLRSLRISHGN